MKTIIAEIEVPDGEASPGEEFSVAMKTGYWKLRILDKPPAAQSAAVPNLDSIVALAEAYADTQSKLGYGFDKHSLASFSVALIQLATQPIPAQPAQPPEDAYIYSGREGYVVSPGLTAEQARQVSAQMNFLYSDVLKLRKPAQKAESEPAAYMYHYGPEGSRALLSLNDPRETATIVRDVQPLYTSPQPAGSVPVAPNGFNYVDVVGKGYEGWINLFFNDHCLSLVPHYWAADIKRVTPKRDMAVSAAVALIAAPTEPDGTLADEGTKFSGATKKAEGE